MVQDRDDGTMAQRYYLSVLLSAHLPDHRSNPMSRHHSAPATAVFAPVVTLALALALPSVTAAQAPEGSTVNGRVTDREGRPLEGALVTVMSREAKANKDGAFSVTGVTIGRHMARVRLLGYRLDSIDVRVPEGGSLAIVLEPTRTVLTAVRVEAQRTEGTALSLSRQRVAENLKVLTVAEEIRALPNANAADAISRLSGVSLQRHEGEGSYVQVRGIDGNLSNITINGAHIAGNYDDKGGGGSRLAKLDGVPAELLALAQVSKTLTPDLDADAIGGSVNIDTKTASDAPGLTLVGAFGRSDLQNAPQGQGAASVGKRMGENSQWGFFAGGSYDRNNRIYDDVEPNYGYKAFNGTNVLVPLTTSRREYLTQRQRTGAAFATDYRWDDHTMLAFKGMWTRFNDAAIRYRQDQTFGKATTNITALSATSGTGTGGSITSNVQQRTPVDQNFMFGFTGTAQPGRASIDYAASATQTELLRLDAGDVTFTQKGLALTWDRSDPLFPLIVPTGAYPTDPTKFAYSAYTIANQVARGRDYSGQVNGKMFFQTEYPSALQFGAKVRREKRTFDDGSIAYALKAGQTFSLAEVLGTFTNPGHFSNRYPLGIAPNDQANAAYVIANPNKFTVSEASKVGALLNVYAGTEEIGAAYGAYSVDVGTWHWLAGLRVERTSTTYTANKAAPDPVTKLVVATAVVPVAGNGSYANVFPSAQLKIALSERTNLRFAASTAIARPLYYDLAPHTSVSVGATAADPSGVSLGNPDLQPTRSVGFDVLLEHFSSDVGVASIGAFQKSVKNFIYDQTFTYVGAPYDGFNATQPRNGRDGNIWGLEGAYVQRLVFLPGMLNGLGVDANATYTQSRSNIEGREGKAFPRQADWNSNAALTYSKGIVSSRVTMQYNGPYIYSLGDGSASVQTGDTYMLEHKQVDASMNVQILRNAQAIFQVLNINNAPFGYYFSGDKTAIKQREVYGTTSSLLFRYSY